MKTLTVDWVQHSAEPPSDIRCGCGETFTSHYEVMRFEGKFILFTRTPCTNCGVKVSEKK